jgi:hypothetical protein
VCVYARALKIFRKAMFSLKRAAFLKNGCFHKKWPFWEWIHAVNNVGGVKTATRILETVAFCEFHFRAPFWAQDATLTRIILANFHFSTVWPKTKNFIPV